jgi:hypothetical protein
MQLIDRNCPRPLKKTKKQPFHLGLLSYAKVEQCQTSRRAGSLLFPRAPTEVFSDLLGWLNAGSFTLNANLPLPSCSVLDDEIAPEFLFKFLGDCRIFPSQK